MSRPFVTVVSSIVLFGALVLFGAFSAMPAYVPSAFHSLASAESTQEIGPRAISQEDVDQIVRMTMDEFGLTPGLAVGVVYRDQVVASRGYGLRDVERKLPVTSQTRFSIASVNKSFTALAFRRLAEAGKIDLDAPIATYIPDLKLPPPLSPEHISLRDLLTHRSGIQNDPISFRTSMSGEYSTAELLILFTRSTAISRAFSYSNIGYILAALVVERHTGLTWQQAVSKEVLEPLDLKHTSTRLDASPGAEVALRYAAEDRQKFVRLPDKTSHTIHAAGGMTSTLEDMLRWLMFNLEDGKLDGRQLVSSRLLEESHSVQMSVKSKFGGFQRVGYGLGWYAVDYEGYKMIQCFGSSAGIRVHLSYIPALRLGIVIMANEAREGLYLPDLIAHRIYAQAFQMENADARFRTLVSEQWEWIRRVREARKSITADYRHPLKLPAGVSADIYTGIYKDDDYGLMRIIKRAGGLQAQMGELNSYLRYENEREFTTDLTPGSLYDPQKLSFMIGGDGRASEFTTTIGRKPSTFVRVSQN